MRGKLLVYKELFGKGRRADSFLFAYCVFVCLKAEVFILTRKAPTNEI